METVDVVVIGGGVLGGAVAFYLAKQKARRVLLLEHDSVAQGNSSLAAGLLTRGRFKPDHISMVIETYKAMAEIETLTGQSLGMHQTGCVYAAVSPDHQNGIRQLAETSTQISLSLFFQMRAHMPILNQIVYCLAFVKHNRLALTPSIAAKHEWVFF